MLLTALFHFLRPLSHNKMVTERQRVSEKVKRGFLRFHTVALYALKLTTWRGTTCTPRPHHLRDGGQFLSPVSLFDSQISGPSNALRHCSTWSVGISRMKSPSSDNPQLAFATIRSHHLSTTRCVVKLHWLSEAATRDEHASGIDNTIFLFETSGSGSAEWRLSTFISGSLFTPARSKPGPWEAGGGLGNRQ